MTASTATLRYSTSTEQVRRDAIARVLAAGRVGTERKAREARAAKERAELQLTVDAARKQGQLLAIDPWDTDWCMICSRCTDHLGEHSPEQVEAWREGRPIPSA